MSADERIRHDAFHSQQDRDLYLCAHTLLRHALSAHTEIPPSSLQFQRNPFGKPALVSTTRGELPQFNLTHTKGLAACIIAGTRPCGIDLELVQQKAELLKIADRWFSAEEVEQLQRLSGEWRYEHFYSLWTLKEALLKAYGCGLLQPLNSFGFRFPANEHGTIELVHQEHISTGESWHLELYSPLSGYRMAVAIAERSGPIPPIRQYWPEF
ncbi:4'-phosphopantetheinyl transferase superfamily protein [Halothiobacillus sp.]|uniref:4'-phosphopantetheinyl transferase family protein n=1 Tax=Halothiobacillus sp. TaxID=1891311 RepID=UPI002606A8B7|nr:4'-phosphopantetheinyl transferase superfamily protein [Halothiobacillus sp.]MDD4965749.1 4'-phosphopantetheinyl transferase superfamily protein [Halothiobacillus sp.]